MAAVDIDGFIGGYQGKTVTVRICGRGDLIEEHQRLEQQLLSTRPGTEDDLHNPDIAALRRSIRDIEAEMTAADFEFRFRALSQKAWQDLLRQHPPTKQQLAEHGVDHNPETFPQAAVAASAISPEMTVEQVDRLMDKLPLGEWRKIWNAALSVNVGEVVVPKSVAAGLIDAVLASAGSSTTAPPEASPAASS